MIIVRLRVSGLVFAKFRSRIQVTVKLMDSDCQIPGYLTGKILNR